MSEKKARFEGLLDTVRKIASSPLSKEEKLESVCSLLKGEVDHYDWVGFYLVNPDKERELVLGPYAGAETEHCSIPFGSGICGQAAERLDTFIIQDVTKETNYLSCSPTVKSEIVLPIMRSGQLLGELDIDSHKLAPFSEEDKKFLENICEIIGGHF